MQRNPLDNGGVRTQKTEPHVKQLVRAVGFLSLRNVVQALAAIALGENSTWAELRVTKGRGRGGGVSVVVATPVDKLRPPLHHSTLREVRDTAGVGGRDADSLVLSDGRPVRECLPRQTHVSHLCPWGVLPIGGVGIHLSPSLSLVVSLSFHSCLSSELSRYLEPADRSPFFGPSLHLVTVK
jgi:hypothetical protein